MFDALQRAEREELESFPDGGGDGWLLFDEFGSPASFEEFGRLASDETFV